MRITTRFVGILTLGLGLGVTVTVESAPPPKLVPAVQAILELADNLDRPGVSWRAKHIVDEFESCDISRVFTIKKKGGAGIGSAVEAGHGDSIQSLVMDWSGHKPPTVTELRRHRKDLLKVARVLKVMAEMAPSRLAMIVPKNNPNKIAAMHKIVTEFKAVTQDFHDAIAKEEPMATRQAAVQLNQVCMNCHNNFR